MPASLSTPASRTYRDWQFLGVEFEVGHQHKSGMLLLDLILQLSWLGMVISLLMPISHRAGFIHL